MGKKLAQGLLGLLALSGGVASTEASNLAQYVFLVDTSASMIGREDGRTVIFPQVQRALMRFAERVVGEAEIRIVPFSQEPQGVARFVLPREREEMLRYIRSLRAEGSSSFIYRSVNKAYDELCSEPRAFYLFTDGLDNSAEPAKMPEPKSPCPLTLVVLGKLPQDFADNWKGSRQNHLAEPPIAPPLQTTPAPPDLRVDRQATTETPGVPVAPTDPTSKAGIVQADVQKEYGEEPSPPPAPTPKPTNPGARPTPPQPRATPPSPQSPPTTPASPQPQPRPEPPATAPSTKPQTPPSAAPRQPAEPVKPQPSAPPAPAAPPAKPSPTPAPPPIAEPQPAQYLLETVGSPSLVDGALVVVYRLEGNAEARLPLLLSLKEVPANLQVSYNDQPTAISLRPGQQFELGVSNQGSQEAVVETAFRVVSAPGALVELPPVLQLKVPPLVVRRNGSGWIWAWAWVGALGALLLGLSLTLARLRRTAQVALRTGRMGTGPRMSYRPSEGGEVRVLSLAPPSLISLDFFGAAPEQRRKYIPALMSECDLGEVIGDAGLERLRVRPGSGGLEVTHIPGHLSLSVEAKDPLTPGRTVEMGRIIYISDISTGGSIGILSVQKM